MFGASQPTAEENKPELKSSSDKLDFLQRQSWQLELIITGFALAGMISGAQEFHDLINRWRDITGEYLYLSNLFGGILKGVYLAYFVTIFHFFLNVVIRCLWIGSLALRGVINKDTYLKQDFHPIFQNFLKKRHGSFDQYINRLDKGASVVFAFTFLMITILFGVMIWGSIYGVITTILGKIFHLPTEVIGFGFMIYFGVSFLYLLDFISAGGMKKGPAKLYFPLYRFFGWLTLARIYRPLYYALLSNRWGKWLIWAIVPYLSIIMILPNQKVGVINFVDRGEFNASYNQEALLKDRYYADADGFRETNTPIILASDVIIDKVLKVRLPLRTEYGATIQALKEKVALKEQATLKEPQAQNEAIENPAPDTSESMGFLEALDEYQKLTNPLRMLKSKQEGEQQALEEESRAAGEAIGRNVARNLFGRGFDGLEANADSIIIADMLTLLELKLDGELVKPENVLLSVGFSGNPIPELVAYFPLHEKAPGLHQIVLRVFEVEDDEPANLNLDRTHRLPFFYAPE